MSCRSMSVARGVALPASGVPSHCATGMIVGVRPRFGTKPPVDHAARAGTVLVAYRCPGSARTLVAVRLQRQVVDYALRRRSLLAEVYSGRTGVSEVCDANPYLLRAAKFHGKPQPVMCPICRKEQLTLVSWVFGDHLGAVSGSARTAEELVLLATALRGVLRPRGGGMPNLQLESPGQVVCARREAGPPAGQPRGTRTARNGARTAS